MMKKPWALLLAMIALLTVAAASAEEEFTPEGDAEGYYDDQLKSLKTTVWGDWMYLIQEDGTAAVIRYSGEDVDLVIPERIDGYIVTAIYSFCFAWISSTKSITMPKSMTTLYTDAFMYSTADTIILNDGLKTIGEYAFFSCDQLTNITIPASVELIGAYAFENCSSLVSVTINEGVLEIADGAFNACDVLTDVSVPASVAIIGENAFPDRVDFRLHVVPNSYAEDYAAQYHIVMMPIEQN
jgi:hypothetical protein